MHPFAGGFAELLALLSAAQPSGSSWLSVPPPEQAEDECKLLGDWVGVLMQGCLVCLFGSIIVAKWRCEERPRPFKIFVLDSLKMCTGSCSEHWVNMILAMLLSNLPALKGHACSWYWINLITDQTMGVAILWGLLRATEWMFGYTSGLYLSHGHKSGANLFQWLKQLGFFLGICLVKKTIVSLLLFAMLPFSVEFGTLCTGWIKNPDWQLFFVVVITPMFSGTFYLCMLDSLIKYKGSATKLAGGEDAVLSEPADAVATRGSGKSGSHPDESTPLCPSP